MEEHSWTTEEESPLDFETEHDQGSEWEVEEEEPIGFEPQPALSVVWESTEYIRMRAGSAEDYGGPYEVNPMFVRQTFPTAKKLMNEDFEIRAINYTEAPNQYGTTVTIGG